eukprot:TRINITY_DN10908_c0_g1_i1.p1 TRINITY_DN10908_c0_g1~~TRINITY_DN10908_c0_g1_i1.p1  ORF type:complete len:504 (+),score=126.30 TRINITY_DN10908_c0_g1_i1:96-1607(+)
MMKRVIVYLILSALFFNIILTGKVHYKNRNLYSDSSGSEFQKKNPSIKSVLMTKEDSYLGDKDPKIRINQSFQQIDSISEGQIQILTYHYTAADSIGFYDDDEHDFHLCCTEELLDKEINCALGQVIYDSKHISPKVIHFDGTGKAQEISFTITPLISGVYYTTYFNCGTNSTIEINGTASSKNPFGYLSADWYPFLWFFGILSIAYLLLGLVWGILSLIYYKKLLMVQNCIGVVILLGLIECLTWYFDSVVYNSNGEFNFGAVLTGIFAATLKRTLSRVLVLIVCMGYGVVKADLGGTTRYRIIIMAVLYFLASGLQQYSSYSQRIGDNDNIFLFFSTVVIFPVAILDTTFYWWIFLSVLRTIQQLSLRKNVVKLQMYKRFFVVLIASGIFAALIIIYQFLLMFISDGVDTYWKTWWMFDAAWNILYFFILTAICIIWRPTSNNTRYAFVESDDQEIILQPMRSNKNEFDIDGIGDIDLTIDLPSFTLDDDEEIVDEVSKMD